MGWTLRASPDFVGDRGGQNFAADVYTGGLVVPVSIPAMTAHLRQVALVVTGGTGLISDGPGSVLPITPPAGLALTRDTLEQYFDNVGGPYIFDGSHDVSVDGTSSGVWVYDVLTSGPIVGTFSIDPTLGITYQFVGAAVFAAEFTGGQATNYQIITETFFEYRQDLGPYPTSSHNPDHPDGSDMPPQPWQAQFYAPRRRNTPIGPQDIHYVWTIGASNTVEGLDVFPPPESGFSHASDTFYGPTVTELPRFRFRQRDDDYRAARIVTNAPTSRQKSNRYGPSNTYY